MSKIAFSYRPRRGGEVVIAYVGGVISFLENIEYILEFHSAPKRAELGSMLEIGYEAINEFTGVLCFRNYVGTTHLAGVTVNVTSEKIGENGVSHLLEEISLLSTSLVFGWRSPISHRAVAASGAEAPIPYHQLQFLRQMVLRATIGTRIQDYLHIIESAPTRRFAGERPVVTIERARRLDAYSIGEMLRRTERLSTLPRASPLNESAIARRLQFGTPACRYFPLRVSEASRRFSYDTVENRFIKYFIGQALSVIYRFLDNQAIHPQLRADCRTMAMLFESAESAPYLKEVGAISSLPIPTQVLLKSEGYKDLWQIWRELRTHASLPNDAVLVARFLQGKDVALLYEYWVFLKVVQITVGLLEEKQGPAIKVSVNDLGASMNRGLEMVIGHVKVSFNPSFTRSGGGAYSTPLRPDVVLEISGKKFIFDAKYRLMWKTMQEDSDGYDSTFLRADLYKMHTYRDAIRNVAAAFIVYPGNQFGFYERNGLHASMVENVGFFDGVGAVPARPGTEHSLSALHFLIRRLIDSTSAH